MVAFHVQYNCNDCESRDNSTNKNGKVCTFPFSAGQLAADQGSALKDLWHAHPPSSSRDLASSRPVNCQRELNLWVRKQPCGLGRRAFGVCGLLIHTTMQDMNPGPWYRGVEYFSTLCCNYDVALISLPSSFSIFAMILPRMFPLMQSLLTL